MSVGLYGIPFKSSGG